MGLATFEDLSRWTPTINALHQAAQVVGRVQATLLPARRNALHLALEPHWGGLASQQMPNGERFDLNFLEYTVYHFDAAGKATPFRLEDHTQRSLLKAIQAHLGLVAVRKAEIINHDEPLSKIDHSVRLQYAEAQYAAFTGIARFRARLEGHFSPVVVWPHHMDISTLVFQRDNVELDEGKAHLNFGFAPFTEGQYERPYLYAYAHPYPDGFEPPVIPKPLMWNTTGWTGIVVSIDDLAIASDTAQAVETYCRQMCEVLLPLLG